MACLGVISRQLTKMTNKIKEHDIYNQIVSYLYNVNVLVKKKQKGQHENPCGNSSSVPPNPQNRGPRFAGISNGC